MKLRSLLNEERFFAYPQSSQIKGQTGCIGYLFADMDTEGTGFLSTWTSFRNNTAEFKESFERVLNELRFGECGFLKNRTTLAEYCGSHPESVLTKDKQEDPEEFGFRGENEQISYIIRLNPDIHSQNLHIFCYDRKWLDHYLEEARNGIRFVDVNSKPIFTIQNGDMIRITNGERDFYERCKYIDATHLEIGDRALYHICEYAEILKRNGCEVIPYRSSLPEYAFGSLPSTGAAILLKKGERGYQPAHLTGSAEEENEKNGVSIAQAKAMMAGSMFGWHVPAADPANYDDNGCFKRITGKHICAFCGN